MSAIALYARHTAGFEARLTRARELLREAAEAHPGRIVQSSSLGAEAMVLTDLIARDGLAIQVATLQTGALHPETLAMIPRIEAHYGLKVEIHEPRKEAVVHFVRKNGSDAMYRSLDLRKACCEMRKVEPLARMLEGRTAWITGRRREQSEHRDGVAEIEFDSDGRTKYNPLADWSMADLWHYIATRDVPYNELHDHFYPSIGCAPCTRAIAVGEDARAGRWWWEDEATRECGLHVQEEFFSLDSRPAPTPASASEAQPA
ncbi:MAG TPA: phosphoadenylyl-sulfate reductase [Ideonella sp.]|nr:phosphoadenylyl-sulfate reductase [Ideonella sp.]